MLRRERRQYDWTFRAYQTPAGNKPVVDWIMALSPDGRDELVDIILYMRLRPQNEWAAEHFKPLEDGISEIRFRDGDLVCRIYGYFGPTWHVQSYALLVGAEKKVKNDRDSKELAKSRRDQIERRQAGFHSISFKE